ncbi:MAG: tetratricopeptide repeat protein [Deltaproteobacteria bacterium]|nr:tetratricopeptide repeat protein [Deltaproteobacteria bacterium]
MTNEEEKAIDLNQLGISAFRAGDTEGALQCFHEAEKFMSSVVREALRTGRKMDLGNWLIILDHLGCAYLELGDLGAAYRWSSLATQKAEEILGAHHRDIGTFYGNFGRVLLAQNDYGSAEDYFTRALNSLRRHLPEDAPECMDQIHNLASVKMELGDYAAAVDMFEAVLSNQERILGGTHPTLISTFSQLALAHISCGRWEPAEEAAQRAAEIAKRSLGAGHPTTGDMEERLRILRQQAP